mmetsp:Transcript_24924/g.38091  ORF Transcript_24924/g.38091 Transcript_24924/m.38091 type:complete len:1527 (-) Transcript_24924:34-4614(-)
MDDNQKLALYRAIAISTASSPLILPLVTPQSRSQAFHTLEEFKKYPGRATVILELLQTERHILPIIDNNGTSNNVDITASTKLYVLTVLQSFLKTDYAKISNNENDRLAIRNAVMVAARQLLQQSMSNPDNTNNNNNNNNSATRNEGEIRFLAIKISALLADIAIRDFPQRWTTFVMDVLSPPDQGGVGLGLWYVPPPPSENAISTKGYGPMIGIKICLEILKIMTEDCTDGDFNSKISTSRRNDVLIGLNEVSDHFLKLIFELLGSQYAIVNAAKLALKEMHTYLIGCGRTVHQMTEQEKLMYTEQVKRRNHAGRIVGDCLGTIEKFCQSMPMDWILGGIGSGSGGTTNDSSSNGHDFVGALFHLLREDTDQLQLQAVNCLQHIVQRKIEQPQWLRIIQTLPQAVSEANDVSNHEQSILAAAEGRAGVDTIQLLVDKLPYHKALSKMMAHTASAHIAHITNDRSIITLKNRDTGPNFQSVSTFLNLLADMLAHPCPKVCAEQNTAWMVLLRDPQISKTETGLLQPCLDRIVNAYMTIIVRCRWDDVDEGIHPYSSLFEEAFDDKESYEMFVSDCRSKANPIIRHISGIDPKLATTVIHRKIQYLFATYCATGGGSDHLDPITGQLTQQSTSVVELEGINLPLDNVIHGLPDWALDDDKQNDRSYMDPSRVQIRQEVRAMIGEVASSVLSWNPSPVWLKFRKVQLIESLKYYWEYDAARLITAIDSLLQSIGAENPNTPNNSTSESQSNLTGDVISLRKRSGSALIAVTKKVPHLLVPFIGQLSDRVKTLLSKSSMLPSNCMHLYEFLSCVATAVEEPVARSNFVADVLSGALNNLELPAIQEAIASPEGLLSFLGVMEAGENPASVTNKANVDRVTNNYITLFSIFNQLLSVGKRCHEAAKKRPNAGIPLPDHQLLAELDQPSQHFPDEGAVSLNILMGNDPFVCLWPRILPSLIKVLDSIFAIWHPQNHAKFLINSVQRYAFAISDDEAYLAQNQTGSSGGIFGEGGTAGSVVRGWDRRNCNLAPKWSGWFNELRNTTLQLLGLLSGSRALYSPEISTFYQSFVNVIANPEHLNCMEHRHVTQYIKQFMEYILLSCPATLYQSHVAPIAAPFFKHMEFRLKCTWAPILKVEGVSPQSTRPLTTSDCERCVNDALNGGDAWFVPYYARGGIFVGDLDSVTSEAVVEKARVEVSRSFADMLQSALALKGDWALVLANIAREEQAAKRNDSSILRTAPSTKGKGSKGPLNADGTKRSKLHVAIEARKLQRIHKLCHFLMLENETIAGYLVLSVAESLNYPDAYTCRRCTKICHRILETVAWVDRYTLLLGSQMFTNGVKAIVYEQKWMVGIEWDMINLIRDVYCRLVLGQTLQYGGQGAAMQAPSDKINNRFEQTKTIENPLQGGGILVSTSDLPRQVLATLPGIRPDMVLQLEEQMKLKRSAKDQKDLLRDLLKIAADNIKETESGQDTGILGRANESESLLNQKQANETNVVQAIPEKLVTHKMAMKQQAKDAAAQEDPPIFSFF